MMVTGEQEKEEVTERRRTGSQTCNGVFNYNGDIPRASCRLTHRYRVESREEMRIERVKKKSVLLASGSGDLTSKRKPSVEGRMTCLRNTYALYSHLLGVL